MTGRNDRSSRSRGRAFGSGKLNICWAQERLLSVGRAAPGAAWITVTSLNLDESLSDSDARRPSSRSAATSASRQVLATTAIGIRRRSRKYSIMLLSMHLTRNGSAKACAAAATACAPRRDSGACRTGRVTAAAGAFDRAAGMAPAPAATTMRVSRSSRSWPAATLRSRSAVKRSALRSRSPSPASQSCTVEFEAGDGALGDLGGGDEFGNGRAQRSARRP